MYLTCILDGHAIHGADRPEGPGSIIHYLLGAYALAKRKGLQFYYVPIWNVGHVEAGLTQKEWDDRWNRLIVDYLFPGMVFNIDNPNIVNIATPNHIGNFDSESDENKNLVLNIHHSYMKIIMDDDPSLLADVREDLIDYYQSKRQVKDIPVAVHIRRVDKFDCDFHPRREYYEVGNFMHKYFTDQIAQVRANLGADVVVHIYSEGDQKDFESFGKDCILHLNNEREDTVESFCQLIDAKVLIMSKSIFSYIAAIYSTGYKIIRAGFWHTLPREVRQIRQVN